MISKLLAALDRLIGPPRKPSWRPVYVIDNQDYLAPESSMTDSEAYQAIIDAYLVGPHEPERPEEKR